MFEVKHGGTVLQFEHSLLSLSKWEAKTKKAFLSTPVKTSADLIDYYECMLLTPDPELGTRVVYSLSPETLDRLAEYINDPQTAAKPPGEPEKGGRGGLVTADTIYSWMVACKIPFHPTETWHVNRVVMLVQLVQHQQQPPKKKSRGERLAQWADINERNKRFFKSNG